MKSSAGSFDALSERDRLTFECAKLDAKTFDKKKTGSYREIDRYTPPKKQTEMLGAIMMGTKGSESAERRCFLQGCHGRIFFVNSKDEI